MRLGERWILAPRDAPPFLCARPQAWDNPHEPLAREGVTVMIHDRCAAQCRTSAGQSIRHGIAAGMNIHHDGGTGLVRV
jgi:hypothetical protein